MASSSPGVLGSPYAKVPAHADGVAQPKRSQPLAKRGGFAVAGVGEHHVRPHAPGQRLAQLLQREAPSFIATAVKLRLMPMPQSGAAV